jgi:hypothetical protein
VGPGSGDDADIHHVIGTPEKLSAEVNDAIKANDRLVTIKAQGNKKLSVIAERVEAIWEE